MSRFQFAGTVKGRAKTNADRYGTKETGMISSIGGWDGMVETRVWWDRNKECDCFEVRLIPHWGDSGKEVTLATGILNHKIEEPFVVPALFA